MKEKAKVLTWWEVIERFVSLGGLEIQNFWMRNKTLLAKSLWRFSSEPNSLWCRIVASRHVPHPFEWLSNGIRGYPPEFVGRHFERTPFFCLSGLLCGGEGRDICFWEDHWVEERPLCVMFPQLYHPSSLKNHFVVNSLVWFGSSSSFSFRLSFSFWWGSCRCGHFSFFSRGPPL